MAAGESTSSDPGSDPETRSENGAYKLDEEGGGAFGVWVPASVLSRYRRLPRSKRRLIRSAVKAFVAELVKRAGGLPGGASVAVENVILNINMPIAMVRAEDTGDAELLKERIRELEFELREARRLLESYREKLEREASARRAAESRASEAERRARDLEDRLRRAEAARRRMEEAARAWARGQLAAEEALRRIANELYVPELIARRSPSPLT